MSVPGSFSSPPPDDDDDDGPSRGEARSLPEIIPRASSFRPVADLTKSDNERGTGTFRRPDGGGRVVGVGGVGVGEAPGAGAAAGRREPLVGPADDDLDDSSCAAAE